MIEPNASKKEISDHVKETIYNSVTPLLGGITPSHHFQKSIKRASKDISTALLKEIKHILKSEKKNADKEPAASNASSPEKRPSKIKTKNEATKNAVSKKVVNKRAPKVVKKSKTAAPKKNAKQPVTASDSSATPVKDV